MQRPAAKKRVILALKAKSNRGNGIPPLPHVRATRRRQSDGTAARGIESRPRAWGGAPAPGDRPREMGDHLLKPQTPALFDPPSGHLPPCARPRPWVTYELVLRLAQPLRPPEGDQLHGMMLRLLARLQVRYECHIRDARREAARREDMAQAGGPVPSDHPALRPQGPATASEAASGPHSASVSPLVPRDDRVPRRAAEMQGLEDDIPS